MNDNGLVKMLAMVAVVVGGFWLLASSGGEDGDGGDVPQATSRPQPTATMTRDQNEEIMMELLDEAGYPAERVTIGADVFTIDFDGRADGDAAAAALGYAHVIIVEGGDTVETVRVRFDNEIWRISFNDLVRVINEDVRLVDVMNITNR